MNRGTQRVVKGRDWHDHKQEGGNTKDNIKGGEVG